MLQRILSPDQEQLLTKERTLLAEILSRLAETDLVTSEQRRRLQDAVAQLDELFMVVVVGEFNAGKSALINALLGRTVVEEGVTPTTAKIHRLAFAEETQHHSLSDGLELLYLPVEILRQLHIVDTPGTNAIDRRHEALTADFIPRSDLVLFITSADRPFSESERSFLEGIRDWGKKVLILVNKVDILPDEKARSEVRDYVRKHALGLLGVEAPIFEISAKTAKEGLDSGDEAVLEASGLTALAGHLERLLDRAELLQLKLGNPLGVAKHLLQKASGTVAARFELIRDDLRTIDDIEKQLAAYEADVDREFELRLTDMDNTLHRLERRGLEFFDERLRLGRIRSLFNKELMRREFESTVVAGAPEEIDSKTEALVDWLVESDLNQWHAVVEHVNRRRAHHAERIVGEVGGRYELDRRGLLDTMGRAARESMAGYDRQAEARKLAEDVQKAVAGTAVVEVGAVGLGATVAYLAGSTAVDATGLVAAGLLAALGMFILPDRRRRAKRELRTKVEELRTQVMRALREQFDGAARSSRAKIREVIAPYVRFVGAEREQLEALREELGALRDRTSVLLEEIEALAAEDGEDAN